MLLTILFVCPFYLQFLFFFNKMLQSYQYGYSNNNILWIRQKCSSWNKSEQLVKSETNYSQTSRFHYHRSLKFINFCYFLGTDRPAQKRYEKLSPSKCLDVNRVHSFYVIEKFIYLVATFVSELRKRIKYLLALDQFYHKAYIGNQLLSTNEVNTT